MALRIRRGLSADRTSITPEQGEFLYTTDTYEVFIGDGVTAGGKPLYTLTSLGGIGLADLSALTPISYNSGTGQFSIQVANGSQAGYLSSADWTTFNNKQTGLEIFDETTSIVTNPSQIKFVGTPVTATVAGSVVTVTISGTGGGGGGVTGVSVATANGLSGVSDLNATNPTLTLSTTITGLLKGDGTAISAATAGTDYQAALTGTGLVNSSGGTISYVTNNSSNWNTAYSQRLSSLTTTGNSGPATLISNVLNIPEYTAAGIGAIASTRTIATTTPLQGGGDLSADRTLSILQATSSQSGYLSSTDWTTFNSKQAALSGTGLVKSTAGTISYITDNSSNWNSAFGWGDHASAGYLLSSTAASTYVPKTRSLTIDGTTYDLTADRTYTINKSLNDLTDVTISSIAGGDLLQYSLASSQWINVPLSALTSIGADNGLSYSGGNVILGGELDFSTSIGTYNSTSSTQYALTFTGGSSAFSSPGAASVKITETSANSTGRAGLYVGATNNHAILVEGRGTPTTTSPSYNYERSTTDLSKNVSLFSKSAQGMSLYTCSIPDETFSAKTNYVSAKIPAVLIEKTTGNYQYNGASETIAEQPYDRFFRNQIYNLLTLRLNNGGQFTERLPFQGVEMSFEAFSASSQIVKLASIRAYRNSTSYSASNDGSELSIYTRNNTEYFGIATPQEYESLKLSSNGVLTLPGYGGENISTTASVTLNAGGGINAISFSPTPKIKYGDTATISINILPGGSGSGASVEPVFQYKVDRVRLTNRGSGYLTAPSVTFSSGAIAATGTAVITASGEVDYIIIVTKGLYPAAGATVTIAAPPSGTQATGVVELGEGTYAQAAIINPGSGYTASYLNIVFNTQTYNETEKQEAILAVTSSGKVLRSKYSLDYLLNSGQAAPFGSGGLLLHNTRIDTRGKLDITSAGNSVIKSFSSGILNIGSDSKSPLSTSTLDSFDNNSSYAKFSPGLLELNTIGAGGEIAKLRLDTYSPQGGSFYWNSYTTNSNTFSDIYSSSSTTTGNVSPIDYTFFPFLNGVGVAIRFLYSYEYGYLTIKPGNAEFKLGASASVGTPGRFGSNYDEYAFVTTNSNLYDIAGSQSQRSYIDIGGNHTILSNGFISDDPSSPSIAAGEYKSSIKVNSVENVTNSDSPGIELKVTNNYTPLAGTSKINITEQKIYIKPNNIGTTNDVLKLVDSATGELGYTTLSTVATSGNYSDLSGTPSFSTVATTGDYNDLSNLPTIPVNLDDLADVSAASPTNGQVLSYNTSTSVWEATTFSASGLTLQTNSVTNANQSTLNLVQGTNITIVDSGTGTVTINSSGGSGGVGLDSVFMLMGA